MHSRFFLQTIQLEDLCLAYQWIIRFNYFLSDVVKSFLLIVCIYSTLHFYKCRHTITTSLKTSSIIQCITRAYTCLCTYLVIIYFSRKCLCYILHGQVVFEFWRNVRRIVMCSCEINYYWKLVEFSVFEIESSCKMRNLAKLELR